MRWAAVGAISAPRLRCECWRPDCDLILVLSEHEWQEVHSQPNRFAVAPEHVAAELEVTVKDYPHYWIVEKQGEAGVLAAELA